MTPSTKTASHHPHQYSPTEPYPFAHPFVSNKSPARRKKDPAGHSRMRDHVSQTTLEPIPELSEDPVWTLADVVGAERAAQIQGAGAVRFHAVGDTGAGRYPIEASTGEYHFGELTPDVEAAQVAIARAMNADLNPSLPGWSPAFFFHLGDVIYFDNTPSGYHDQFYSPYKYYNGKIIGIPGNHDGEVLLGHQPSTCYEFMKNFCPPHAMVPPDASPIVRQMSAQPGVYWWLQTPFLDLVGLFSNVAEGPGYIRGQVPGEHQYDWLKDKVLPAIAEARRGGTRKALVIATHHPPITATLFNPDDEGHASSDQMSQDLDAAYQAAAVWPDAYLSGHVHNYQRFTRTVALGGGESRDIPYLIAGGGGRVPQKVTPGQGQEADGIRFERSHAGHGYLLVTASPDQLQIQYVPVPALAGEDRDEVVVNLA